MLDRLTDRAKEALGRFKNKDFAVSGKLLAAIVATDGMGTIIAHSIPELKIPKTKKIDLTGLVKEAYYLAAKFEHPYVGTEHLLLALLNVVKSPDYNKARVELVKLNILPSTLNTGAKGRKTPLLDLYGSNLNVRTLKDLDKPLVYREVYESLVAGLLLKTAPNVLLIGQNGVGKRTLVELLARNITSLNVPQQLAGYQIIEFDMLAFMTGVFNKGGNFDAGMIGLTEELRSLGRTILYVKNFQNVFFATAGGFAVPMFYSMFRSALDAIGVRMIATLNDNLYDKIFSENEHMIEDFSVIEVPEPTEKESKKIMETMSLYLSEFHDITISTEMADYIFKKAKNFDTGTSFPKKGVDLMDHCCAYVSLRRGRVPENYKKLVDESFGRLAEMDFQIEHGSYEKALKLRGKIKSDDTKLVSFEKKIFFDKRRVTLTKEDVDSAFEAFKEDKHVEESRVNLTRLALLAQRVKESITGQDEAVDTVTRSLIRSRLGLRSKKRPLGNFLFLGPTGVGKTELAKVIAEVFFGEKSLIRLDMSDFSEKHTVARLVGAPPGYVGYGEGGELTTKISTHPDSVVLFDEIEKAHPDVLNILLQIMEEGELSDMRGTVFDFSRSVVILTSNLGTEILQDNSIGFELVKASGSKISDRLKLNLKKIIKPELLNRFDEIIVFNKLGTEAALRVLDLLIKDITEHLVDQSIKLSVTPEVKQYLLSKGYSEEYGARGLRRTIDKELLDVIATFLLEHKERPLHLKAVIGKSGVVEVSNRAITVKKR